jgi:hypothetical protein
MMAKQAGPNKRHDLAWLKFGTDPHKDGPGRIRMGRASTT